MLKEPEKSRVFALALLVGLTDAVDERLDIEVRRDLDLDQVQQLRRLGHAFPL
ncbi:hypothetical protein [Saccharopolyspora mangrovi]|uniref:Uncharacterized protein n=1 Tax=Saccharopolyspora mangrovi TaxID=3082379 RepID=A0ABU6AJ63_9PSEU|nr:hypothetical protein [Saccharopolyspora sp. S2-29]MEB3371556.1 hypothetical protein [Saccharopolyspora sp. S2-29]